MTARVYNIDEKREDLGKCVRIVWLRYAIEHNDQNHNHLLKWEQLSEYDKEVDRQIGETLYQLAILDLHLILEEMLKRTFVL